MSSSDTSFPSSSVAMISNTLAPSSKLTCIEKYPFESTSTTSALMLTTASGIVCPLIVILFVPVMLSSAGCRMSRNRVAEVVAVEVVVEVTVPDVVLMVEPVVLVELVVEVLMLEVVDNVFEVEVDCVDVVFEVVVEPMVVDVDDTVDVFVEKVEEVEV
jgi:hypothetical protein